MWKIAAMTLLTGLVAGLSIVGLPMPASGATQTITGTVIDLYCYVANKENTGMHHTLGRDCAWACVKYTPQPVGILTSDGRVFELAGGVVAKNNAKIAEHITKRVRVTGEVSLRDGMPTITTNEVTVVP
jgi:hypothetical protein